MACKPDKNFRIIDCQPAVDVAIADLQQEALLAVRCEGEGVSPSRKEKLSLISLATKEKAYVFDILTMGESMFNSGLREILENSSHEKLMFDCREESDALWHHFKIKLSGVLDVQLLEIMYRRENTASKNLETSSKSRSGKYTPRSHRPGEVECLYGLYHCMELYVKDKKLFETQDKKAFRQYLNGITTSRTWKKRPLSTVDFVIEPFVVNKCLGMFRLFDEMKGILSGGEKERLLVASEKFADFYRSRKERLFSGYETNSCSELDYSKTFENNSRSEEFRSFDPFQPDAYLPLDIIPEKGTLSFPRPTTICVCCSRKFPREEFSNTQLRNGEQKCRVCKEIKRRADVESSRERHFELQEVREALRWYYRRDSDEYDCVDFLECGNDECYVWGCEFNNCDGTFRH